MKLTISLIKAVEMFGLGTPISNFNRSEKNVQLQILRLSCIFGFVVASAILFMNSSEPSEKNELISHPQILNAIPKSINKSFNKNNNKTITKQTRVISIEGKDKQYAEVNLTTIPNKSTVTELDFHKIQIDPQVFTETLKEFINLKTIKLNDVKLTTPSDWNFQRVYLPKIELFYVDMSLGFHDQYTDYIDDFKEENLSKMIFYEKNRVQTTDVSTKLSEGSVNITIMVDGWSVFCLKPSPTLQDSFEVIIAVDFSDKLLNTLKQNLNIIHLTMTECSVSKSAFPSQLKYLNLYRVNITEGDITQVLNEMTNLTELFLELRNGTMKMSAVPKSVMTLAISDIEAVYSDEDKSSAEMVALGFPMDPDIVKNFDKIFISVKKVSIFEPTNGTQYLLLQSVLKSKSVEWIYFEGFERTENASRNLIEDEIEIFLEKLDISPEERHVLIVRDNNNVTSNWRREELTKEQQLSYRYNLLGWDEYITWDTYMDNFLPKDEIKH